MKEIFKKYGGYIIVFLFSPIILYVIKTIKRTFKSAIKKTKTKSNIL